MDSNPESSASHDDGIPTRNEITFSETAPSQPSPPIYINPDHAVAARADDTRRMVRLLWIFAILLAAVITPTVVGKIRYAYSYNTERARADASLETLQHLDLSELSLAFRSVAAGVGPSVVNIQTTRIFGSPLYDERRHLFGDPRPFALQGQGSGVIVDPDGYIVTNNHVIELSEAILVQLTDGQQLPAEVVGSDPLTDIAVLKIDQDNLIAREWGNSDDLEVGSMVWAIGSPFGLQRSITFGIISAKNRRGVTPSLLQDFLQTDAAVNPGNSGGPLVNIQGEIVGINTAIVGQAYQGISFAIPSNTARKIYEKIRKEGQIKRGWLGVSLGNISSDSTPILPRRGKIQGVLIAGVVENSPAARAGLRPDDVILEWNGMKVSDPTTFSLLVAETEVGSKVTVRILRQQRERILTIKVGEYPTRFP
ncbi:MAG: trypsin-like peptidase domain-containing protein [Pirellulales bacterium]|nr:trypsin-like peptidase domain-containing protein [Pirellulales bacterium]